ncbi:MAG: HXXEE domain-containing protein [Promethearchaeota archaeon]
MVTTTLLISYALLLIFQILHVFEEVGMEIHKHKLVGSLKKYLRVASGIMCVYLLSYLFIVLEFRIGTWMGLLCSFVAMCNFLVHTIAYLKIRDFRGTIAAGVFSSIPLGILGGINFILLVRTI